MNYLTKAKWMPILLVLLIVMNIVTVSAFWWLNRSNKQVASSKAGAIEFLVRELKFDSLQHEQLKQLREEHRFETREYRRLNKEAKDAFFDLLKEKNVSDSLMNETAHRSVYYDAEMVKSTFRHFQKIRAICTLEQQDKFDEIIHEVLRMQAGPQGPPPHERGRPPHQEPH